MVLGISDALYVCTVISQLDTCGMRGKKPNLALGRAWK